MPRAPSKSIIWIHDMFEGNLWIYKLAKYFKESCRCCVKINISLSNILQNMLYSETYYQGSQVSFGPFQMNGF